MGGGSYDYAARSLRAKSEGYATKSTHEIFESRNINSAMDPYGLVVRESHDSDEHPNSFPIIIALDVTGSMGSIPAFLVKEGLPNIMKTIIDSGIADPQVLFLGIGDHECDRAPLQVGQFESSDALLDHWLTKVYLEGGGGGNDGESYLLAWSIGGKYTSIDSFEKRGKKGVLITIGDEKTLKTLPIRSQENIYGPGQYGAETADQLLDKASEKYNCYHLHICQTRAGSDPSTKASWKQLMGPNLVMVENKEDVDKIISDIVIKEWNSNNGVQSSKAQKADSHTEELDGTSGKSKSEYKPSITL